MKARTEDTAGVCSPVSELEGNSRHLSLVNCQLSSLSYTRQCSLSAGELNLASIRLADQGSMLLIEESFPLRQGWFV